MDSDTTKRFSSNIHDGVQLCYIIFSRNKRFFTSYTKLLSAALIELKDLIQEVFNGLAPTAFPTVLTDDISMATPKSDFAPCMECCSLPNVGT
jgi:hypothetical protein